jgi:hypothetical protein
VIQLSRRGGLVSLSRGGGLEIQLSRGVGCDPVIKRGRVESSLPFLLPNGKIYIFNSYE